MTNGIEKYFSNAANKLKEEINYLSDIDAETGDGDHGIAIGRIATGIIEVSEGEKLENYYLKDFFTDLMERVATINGGSITPLWAMMFEGIAESLQETTTEINEKVIKNMFEGALKGVRKVSDAKIGDKTLIDALEPAVEATLEEDRSVIDILRAAAQAAKKGALNTKKMEAKYGRAKNLRKESVGHLDPGAVSLSRMIELLYNECNKN